ncbi:GNAT family N-acetyltransferase [Parabacteroides sp. PF5-6]|uniref:GNAT family N-acetyltransferase n=1 Tax=Parabacteroides sp. PF5-6 TaxID=1742403 RepID=UPI00240499B5|nr:GNAT family N-acetyltransferase [Parabacteroides sp. PF5-6]
MFSIRTADPNDRYLINELASQVWGNTYGHILSKEQLDYMFNMMYAPESIARQITELGHQYFIVSHDNIPSGYLSIEQQDAHTYIFQKIYALPRTQGTGMGRYMIEQGIAYLKSIHAQPFSVILYVNRENPALGFYRHLGFEVIDTRDHPIGNGYYMNDYIMSINISE